MLYVLYFATSANVWHDLECSALAQRNSQLCAVTTYLLGLLQRSALRHGTSA